MTTLESLTAEDLHELELAPLWVLSAVGAADGKIDEAERDALVDGVGRCAAHSDDLVRGVLERVSKEFDSIWAAYTADERFAIHGLRTVADVLARVADPLPALHFKQTLVQLGVEVADASGGVLGLGRKRSHLERKALNDVAEALKLPSRRLIAASRSSFDSILVPLDGSAEAEAALSTARALADQFQSQVALLEVVPDPRTLPVAAEGYVAPAMLPTPAELSAAASSYLGSVRSTYGAAEWRAFVGHGEPANVIVAHAREIGVDLIVMATAGSAGLKRVFEGKVAENVARLTDIPVLLVPVAADEF